MKKIILMLTGFLLAVIVGLSTATNTEKKSRLSFMFVMQAKQGEIIRKGDKAFLVLEKTDILHVIEFSDRPYRVVRYITGTDLAKDWKIGKNSFEKDPPNAVLIADGRKAKIIILETIKVTEKKVIYRFTRGINEKEGIIKNIVVVIDST